MAGRLPGEALTSNSGCIAGKSWSGTPRPVAAAASVGGHCACPLILHVRRYMTSKGQRAVRGRHARARPPDQAQAARDRRSPGSKAPPATLRRHLRPPAPHTSARHPPPGAQPEPARGTGQRYCVTRILASAALYGSRIYGAKRLSSQLPRATPRARHRMEGLEALTGKHRGPQRAREGIGWYLYALPAWQRLVSFHAPLRSPPPGGPSRTR